MGRKEITRLWREYGYGRLYWRSSNQHWRDWDSKAVAMAKDGPVRTHFYSRSALVDELIECGAPVANVEHAPV
jgi:hypothetical protein